MCEYANEPVIVFKITCRILSLGAEKATLDLNLHLSAACLPVGRIHPLRRDRQASTHLHINIMAWLYLIIAGLFEVGFTTCLKLSNNFSIPKWTIGFLVCATLSFFLLSKAIQTIPMGTGYAVWTGIGAAGTVIVGIILFKEPADVWRLLFIALLIGSVIGLKAVSAQ